MKFISLKIKNFKPYYTTGQPHEIIFFDKTRNDRNISITIGQTGFGKTSLSESILWCLFGEGRFPAWEEFVNHLAISINKEKKENIVNMYVEFLVEKDGDEYRIMRDGNYDLTEEKRACNSKLKILCDGEPLSNPEEFIANNFPTTKLMDYFIFDADDILKTFSENQEKTIRDHVNKLVGVEKIDKIIESLYAISGMYDEEINSLRSKIKSDVSARLNDIWSNIKKKEEAIKGISSTLQGIEKKKKRLFKDSPPPEAKEFYNLTIERDSLQSKLNELNEEFLRSNITPYMDLLLLREIIEITEKKIEEGEVCEEEFFASSQILKATLGNKYKGMVFNEHDEHKLINTDVQIDSKQCSDLSVLNLTSGEGKIAEVIQVLKEYKNKMEDCKESFLKSKKKYTKCQAEYYKIINRIKQIGESSKNIEVKEKIKSFNELDGEFNLQKGIKKDIEDSIVRLKDEYKELQKELDLNEEQQKEIGKLVEKQVFVKELIDLSDESRKSYLSDLIKFVNSKSSEFLQSVIKDVRRFNSIEIDSSYKFYVKRESGDILQKSQINKGALELSLLSFFFGLSFYLEKGIPYVIDNPLIRLDPGHDKRLVELLSKTREQIILHLIPGKEYTVENFKWLGPYINVQNWIIRNEYLDDYLSSFEQHDPDNPIEFDIDKF